MNSSNRIQVKRQRAEGKGTFDLCPLNFDLSCSTRPHQRKQDDVADRRAVGEQHDQPVDADAFSGGGRHAVFERPDVILVHRVRLFVAASAAAELLLEASALLRRVDRKSTRLNSSHSQISYAVFCLKKKIKRAD